MLLDASIWFRYSDAIWREGINVVILKEVRKNRHTYSESLWSGLYWSGIFSSTEAQLEIEPQSFF